MRENSKRDLEIFNKLLKGTKVRELTVEYQLSKERIYNIRDYYLKVCREFEETQAEMTDINEPISELLTKNYRFMPYLVKRILRQQGLKNIDEFQNYSERELLRLKNCGKKTLYLIRNILKITGKKLKE